MRKKGPWFNGKIPGWHSGARSSILLGSTYNPIVEILDYWVYNLGMERQEFRREEKEVIMSLRLIKPTGFESIKSIGLPELKRGKDSFENFNTFEKPFNSTEIPTDTIGALYTRLAEALHRTELAEQKAKDANSRADIAERELATAQKSSAAAQHRADIAETKLTIAETRISSLEGRIAIANDRIREANQLVAGLRRESQPRQTGTSQDPQGFFEALGLSPNAFRGLSDEQIASIVNAVYRIDAHRDHPDKGGDRDIMDRLNRARGVLSNPQRRRDYMTRTGEFDPRRR